MFVSGQSYLQESCQTQQLGRKTHKKSRPVFCYLAGRSRWDTGRRVSATLIRKEKRGRSFVGGHINLAIDSAQRRGALK